MDMQMITEADIRAARRARFTLRQVVATAVATLVLAAGGFLAGRWCVVQWDEYQALREDYWYLRGVTLGHPAKSAKAAWAEVEKRRAAEAARAEEAKAKSHGVATETP